MHVYGISGYGARVLEGGQNPAYEESSDRFRNEDKGRIYLYDLYIGSPGKERTPFWALTLINSTSVVTVLS